MKLLRTCQAANRCADPRTLEPQTVPASVCAGSLHDPYQRFGHFRAFLRVVLVRPAQVGVFGRKGSVVIQGGVC